MGFSAFQHYPPIYRLMKDYEYLGELPQVDASITWRPKEW